MAKLLTPAERKKIIIEERNWFRDFYLRFAKGCHQRGERKRGWYCLIKWAELGGR